jgi:dCTP deaminase
LGRWFLSFKQNRVKSVDLADRNRATAQMVEESRTREHFVPFGQEFVLHPGRFVLGATLEWLKMPSDISGYVTGKSSLGRHGLVIETAAGIHPNFEGCLTLELANVGEVPLIVRPGMQICQIFLHEISANPEADHGRFSGRRKPTIIKTTSDPVMERMLD